MDPFTAAMIGSTALSIFGNYQSNMAKSAQEAQNAAYYKKQADFARLAEARQNALAEFDYTNKISAQQSSYTGSNISLEGSAVITIAGTFKQFMDEAFAIKKKGELEYTLATMRMDQSQGQADMLSSVGYNLLQAGATGASAYTSYLGATAGSGKGGTVNIHNYNTSPASSGGSLVGSP